MLNTSAVVLFLLLQTLVNPAQQPADYSGAEVMRNVLCESLSQRERVAEGRVRGSIEKTFS